MKQTCGMLIENLLYNFLRLSFVLVVNDRLNELVVFIKHLPQTQTTSLQLATLTTYRLEYRYRPNSQQQLYEVMKAHRPTRLLFQTMQNGDNFLKDSHLMPPE